MYVNLIPKYCLTFEECLIILPVSRKSPNEYFAVSWYPYGFTTTVNVGLCEYSVGVLMSDCHISGSSKISNFRRNCVAAAVSFGPHFKN